MDALNDLVAFSAPHKLPPAQTPQIRPQLGIRKRKPRSTTPLTAAPNSPARLTYPAPPARVPSSSPVTDPLPEPPTPPTATTSPPPPIPAPPRPTAEHKRKGLRHFAVRVTRKVEEKDVTTYNEVADELVAEERLQRGEAGAAAPLIDEKNIRRRVYDSLNVLMAMNIISKAKKQITWQGLHCARGPNPQSDAARELPALMDELAERRAAVQRKREQLAATRDMLNRTAAIIDRNREAARAREDPFAAAGFMVDISTAGLPSFDHPMEDQSLEEQAQAHAQQQQQQAAAYAQQQAAYDSHAERLTFPFYIVSAKKDTKIELEVSPMRDEVRFTFDSVYEIFDNNAIVSRIPVSPLFTLPQNST